MESFETVDNLVTGTGVRHKLYGDGRISALNQDQVQVDFSSSQRTFWRYGFLDHFVPFVEDKIELTRLKAALLADVLITKENALFLQRVIKYLKVDENETIQQLFGDGLTFSLKKLKQQENDSRPVINHGKIKYDWEEESFIMRQVLLYLIDEHKVASQYAGEGFLLEQIESLAKGIIDTAKIYDSEARYAAFVIEGYDEELDEKHLPKDGIYLGLRLEKPIHRLSEFLAVKSVFLLFVEKCDFLIQQYACQPEWEEIDEPGSPDDGGNQVDAESIDDVALGYAHFVVISNRRGCINNNHEMQKINALLSVIQPSGRIAEIKLPAFYCRSCDEYYLNAYDFLRAKNSGGVLLCRIIQEEMYEQERNRDFDQLATQSPLNLCGYNVSKAEGLSEIQRRVILDSVLASGFQTLLEVRSHISWLIQRARGNYRYVDAISKWEADLKYLQEAYHFNGKKVQVGSITTKW